MSRSPRADRPYVRKSRRTAGQSETPSHGPAARLAALAGSASRPSVEQLETRQLLFSLTVTPADIDPFTGLGTVTAQFAYVIPYLRSNVMIGMAPDDVEVENFNEDDPAVPPTPVVTGTVFNGSNIQVTHNIAPGTNFQLVREPGSMDANRLEVRTDTGQFFGFRFQDEMGAFRTVTQASFDIASPTGMTGGLSLANTVVTLLRNGQVITQFTGAALGAQNTTNPGTGVGTFNFTVPGPTDDDTFDQIVFTAIGGPNTTFFVDNIQRTVRAGNFAGLIEPLIFGATVVFTGPVGATAQFLDLYGREIQQRLDLGTPQGSNGFVIVDPDDNGVPNFNDGIGRINISGTDALSALTLFGGTVMADMMTGFAFMLPDAITGIYDDFEQAGFGYALDNDPMNPASIGLPPGSGSLILGSPFVRDNSSQGAYNPGALATTLPVMTGFNRADQGVFVTGGSSIRSVYIHGLVHGSSQFTGAADRAVFGSLVGSLSVAGDLGALVVGSDAGLWQTDPDADLPPGVLGLTRATGGQLVVGRTLGEVAIAGRSLMDITVLGDINTPSTRPPRDVFRYFEKEYGYAFDPATMDGERVTMQLTLNNTDPGGFFNDFFFRRADQALVFGEDYYRNDAILSAEWVGSVATAVQISGDLETIDPVSSEDNADVFAFASDGSQPLVIRFDAFRFLNVRIVDQDGRVLAGVEAPDDLDEAQFLRYQPDGPGIYYLVVSSEIAGATGDNDSVPYFLTLTGLAPTSLGSVRTGAGFSDEENVTEFPTINVLSGSMGALRVGTGLVDGGGMEVAPTSVINTEEDDDDQLLTLRGINLSVAGNLYNITAGTDINGELFIVPVDVFVGGDFGVLVTGLSPLGGVGPLEGDVAGLNLEVGGRIARLDIRGGIGVDQDTMPFTDLGGGLNTPFTVRTGSNGVSGDIGMIRTGSRISGDTFFINMLPGSTLGAFLVAQDVGSGDLNAPDPFSGIFGTNGLGEGVRISTGSGSDVRFVDFPRLDLTNSADTQLPIIGGTPLILVDDRGGSVRIEIVGGANGVTLGLVRAIPIDGSQGVAIGRITANLTGGARLLITSLSQPGFAEVVSIGHIFITDADANSSIAIEGPSQVDVWRISQAGGDPFASIENTTPLGDIVAIDVIGVARVTIATGDLGRTQVPLYGPRLIGPFLNLASGYQMGVGDPIGVNPGPMGALFDADWMMGIYAPIGRAGVAAGGAFLEDIGSPVDGYLNGIITRDGMTPLSEVAVGGAVGDVMTQGAEIVTVRANSDGVTPLGRFDGLVGTIYGTRLTRIEIGDGLLQRAPNPFSTTGIFAENDIQLVIGEGIDNAFISSSIVAGNVVFDAGPAIRDGINRIELSGGGDYTDAFIGVANLDSFWLSINYGDDGRIAGGIFEVIGTDADFFRSRILTGALDLLSLTNGFYDASRIDATASVGTIVAAGYRNTTLFGSEIEFRPSVIDIGRDLGTLTTFNLAGDVDDLRLDVFGSVLTEISGRSINRVQIDVNNRITLIRVLDSVRGSGVVAGRLDALDAGQNVRSSSITVAGPILSIIAGDSITNTSVSVTGLDGRIDEVTAANGISGSLTASGPIGAVTAAAGDIVATITTTTERGTVDRLQAGRDLNITTDISAALNQLVAGRHIGSIAERRIILVRGDLVSVSAPSGQIYSDLRVGQGITGSITIGAVNARPGDNQVSSGSIVAFGSITRVDITGDFNGDIISYTDGIGSVTITNGSFLPGNLIAAYDGDIRSVTIVGGHLLGDIYADYILFEVRVVASADGVFGDIGVNPALSSGVFADTRRNQLPPGVAADAGINGPTIRAGRNIGNITVENGSVFEATIHAFHAIGFISVNGNIQSDGSTGGRPGVIAAGDSIWSVSVAGNVENTLFVTGLTGFGADGRAGGVGPAADSLKFGWINLISIGGDTANVAVSAGMAAGDDGEYNTGDERVVPGVSFVDTVSVGGAVSNTSVYFNSHVTSIAPGIFVTGESFALLDGEIHPGFESLLAGYVQIGAGGLGISLGADTGTVTFSGPGRAFWDSATGTIVLINTSLDSNLVVRSDTGRFTDLNIIGNDDASMGLIDVQADLFGDSDILIDAFLGELRTGAISGTGRIAIGGDARTITTGRFTGGNLSANHVATLAIGGDFGVFGSLNEAKIDLLSGGSIAITGNAMAPVNIARDLSGFTVGGSLTRGAFRSGGSVGTVAIARDLSESFISANNAIGGVTVGGNMFDAQITAGGDLGSDALPGGAGDAADRASTGRIGSVSVVGSAAQSDIVAGALRGPDSFFGTADDPVADGRATLGDIAIGGSISGSTLGSESYRFSTTGRLGAVTSGGQPAINQGNFGISQLPTQPLPIRVTNIRVDQSAQVVTARVFFNQAMNSSTISGSLTISEVRDAGTTLIRLIEGADYSVAYDDAARAAVITFSRALTDRNLRADGTPTPGLAGPGVYRFELDAAVLRAQVGDARLDGDGDGFVSEGEDFTEDTIVGDAGDKLVGERAGEIDFYAPADLNIVLDNNRTPDGVPDSNSAFTVRGTIGDHPDNDVNIFRFAGDEDAYRITLQAGQILRLGAMEGAARFADRFLADADGNIVSGFGDSAVFLPTQTRTDLDVTFPEAYLIKETGTYFIVVANPLPNGSYAFNQPGVIPNINPVPGGVGDYTFALQVFDDANSGFRAPTDAGNGDDVVNAPPPTDFAGPDGAFGTADDLSQILIGGFFFTLSVGPDGTPGNADDAVTGSNGRGITSVRTGGDRLSTSISSSIGPPGFSGLIGEVFPDVDVYHLNAGAPIAPGTIVRITVKLTDLGANLGSRSQSQIALNNFAGSVQLGVFDTTAATDIDDALLVFSPSDFRSIGGAPGTIASNGVNTYGYDENGDFFIQFSAPGQLGAATPTPASYAVYLQGVFNTDYGLEIVTQGNSVVERRSQNIFLETRGGTIDWLEAGDRVTSLTGFSSAVVGFTGTVQGLGVDTFILTNLLANLRAAFAAAGVDVTISTNPADFEFQDFSTIFLTSLQDPITLSFEDIYGFSEHSDPLNTDRNDEAVVFIPSLSTLGLTPSEADVNLFTQSLTAAVGRRVGELLGLRTETGDFPSPLVSIMAANSVNARPLPGGVYRYSTLDRALSSNFDTLNDTNFFLGRQNAQSLLDAILSEP